MSHLDRANVSCQTPPPTPTIIRGTPLIFRIRAKYLPSALWILDQILATGIGILITRASIIHPSVFSGYILDNPLEKVTVERFLKFQVLLTSS